MKGKANMNDMVDEKKVIIELQNVKRDFMVGDELVHALRGVSFKIMEGEFVLSWVNPARESPHCSISWAVLTRQVAENII